MNKERAKLKWPPGLYLVLVHTSLDKQETTSSQELKQVFLNKIVIVWAEFGKRLNFSLISHTGPYNFWSMFISVYHQKHSQLNMPNGPWGKKMFGLFHFGTGYVLKRTYHD